MANTVWECDYEIRKLNNAKNQINNIRSYLSSYISNVDTEVSRLVSNYSVDGSSTGVVSRLRSLRNKANETSNYLKNTVIPGINSCIYELQNQRQELENEEM